MRATTFPGPQVIRAGERPDPSVQHDRGGSDHPGSMGHELVVLDFGTDLDETSQAGAALVQRRAVVSLIGVRSR